MLQYFPGMITSVSTFFPYLCALPRSNDSILCSRLSDARERQRARIGDLSGEGARRAGRWRSEIDLRLRGAHTPDVVAIRRRDAPLAVTEGPHVAAEAGAAARRIDDASGRRERGEDPLLRRLHPDALRSGIHDDPHARR